MQDALATAIGLGLLALLGPCHYLGLRAIAAMRPRRATHPLGAMAVVWLGLVALHVAEIAGFAAIYATLDRLEWIGRLATTREAEWGEYLYFSGMSYVTLGYTDIHAVGPIKQVAMLQSLGGFMVLTWSATFIYSVWGKGWSH